ncbi:hypothetical protein H257_08119 [Aphanomyces astaci]|uniref:Uncharacterized protein n=1 Tax=Aphanomyces astaci TaxID=112090 RepID=W4GG19_APHAT|nr:hypothetical protein H257_08119 [Aphanomyces astaci]ETV78627.1 hypothetical protein H257_08119 [Aphanomyces astaci]|eukprot:XP_009832208.1 hypothetical protein H257_08119 [Aphanomyces astaci]
MHKSKLMAQGKLPNVLLCDRDVWADGYAKLGSVDFNSLMRTLQAAVSASLEMMELCNVMEALGVKETMKTASLWMGWRSCSFRYACSTKQSVNRFIVRMTNPTPSDVIPRLIVGEVVLVTVSKLTTFHGVASCIFESLDATGTTPPRPRLPPTLPLALKPLTMAPPMSTHQEDQHSSDYNLSDNDTVLTELIESQGSLDERTVPQSGGSGSCISLDSVEGREFVASVDDEDGTAIGSDAHSAAHNASAIKIEEQASG